LSEIPRAEIEAVFGVGADVATVEQPRTIAPSASAGLWFVSCGDDRAVLKLIHRGGTDSRWPATDDPSGRGDKGV
jgi:hypothetical protein